MLCTHTYTHKHTQSANIWKYPWPLINSMKCITEYYSTTASEKEMATERARKREREREIRKIWRSYTNGMRVEWRVEWIGDIVFGMHKVWWIGFFSPNTYVPDLSNWGRIRFFCHKNTNRCDISLLGIISTFFLLVWLENILGISEKSNVLI